MLTMCHIYPPQVAIDCTYKDREHWTLLNVLKTGKSMDDTQGS